MTEINEYGEWLLDGTVKMLIEPSQKWFDENPTIEPELQSPSEIEELTNYVLDVDFRLMMVEMGLM